MNDIRPIKIKRNIDKEKDRTVTSIKKLKRKQGWSTESIQASLK